MSSEPNKGLPHKRPSRSRHFMPHVQVFLKLFSKLGSNTKSYYIFLYFSPIKKQHIVLVGTVIHSILLYSVTPSKICSCILLTYKFWIGLHPCKLLYRIRGQLEKIIWYYNIKARFFCAVFLICIKALRIEGVICCTDYKALWGRFVICMLYKHN